MKKFKQYLNHIFIDGLSGMALGLFSTLIIGTILQQIGNFIGGNLGTTIFLIGKLAAAATCAGIGVGVAYKFKETPLIVISAAVSGMVGGFATKILAGNIISDTGVITLAGPGEPLGAFIAALVGIEIGHLIAGKTKIDIIITPSKFFKEKFVEFGYEEDKVRYIPNFINIEEYKPNYNFKNYYIYVGRLSEEKGLINLIKAAEKNKEYLLRIIGTGPIEGELKKYIEERNIQNIVFDGFKTGEELKALIRSARFLVIPSICYENNPMSVIESMALGKVVVGSNIGGIPELIKNDKLLFKHNDIDSMANIIREIFELTQEEIIKIGQKNRKLIEENYSKEVHYNKLMEIYEEVINKYEGVKK